VNEPWAAIGIRSGDRVLDVGFRDVLELEALATRVGPTGWVIGIDVDRRRVAAAVAALSGRTSGRVEVSCGSLLDLPYDDASFDLVLCKGVLHEVRRPDAAVAEMGRVCRTGGVVCLIEMKRFSRLRFELYRWKAWLRGRRTGDIWPGFTRQRVEQAMTRGGLEVERYEILPTMWRLGDIRIEPFLVRAVRRSAGS